MDLLLNGKAEQKKQIDCRRKRMISDSCNFEEFLSEISSLDYPEMILLANDEATAAERAFYKQKHVSLDNELFVYQEYALALKSFIYFLRNGIQPSPIREFDFQRFQDVRDNWQNLQAQC